MEQAANSTNVNAVTAETKIVWNVKQNPKREGSKAHARFSKYMGSKTVADYLNKEGTKADLKYDWEKGFIDLDGVTR